MMIAVYFELFVHEDVKTELEQLLLQFCVLVSVLDSVH